MPEVPPQYPQVSLEVILSGSLITVFDMSTEEEALEQIEKVTLNVVFNV